tara:strand:- start:298 stop:459 length:162 start_codon:yes stop_codon:yes gene_type:complete
MDKYDITINFKSQTSGSELGFLDEIIYKLIREKFWNISNYSYDFKIAKEKKRS